MIQCKPDCSLSKQCLYSIATKALVEIEESRKKGLGNKTVINSYFLPCEGGARFVIDIYPETNSLTQVTVYSFSQRFFSRLDDEVSFNEDYSSKKSGGGATSRDGCSASFISKTPERFLKYRPWMNVASYLKTQANLETRAR
jgi:hypothetical protein